MQIQDNLTMCLRLISYLFSCLRRRRVPSAKSLTGFTKPTALFDATIPIRILPNITHNPEFVKLVGTVNALRTQLIEDKTLRSPLLETLLLLYTSDDTKKKIRRLRPRLPTDNDIISFVDAFWPDIHLMGPMLTSDDNPWDGVWGSTFSGTGAVPHAEISILMPLVRQWINSEQFGQSFGPRRTLSSSALCWFTSSVILHEVMHRLIVWWGKGECDTPEVDGIGNESGSYIERSWYGGVTVAEFPEDKTGVLTEMISVGVEIGNRYYPIDRPMAAQLLQMDTGRGLPVFHPQDIAPPRNPSTILLKSADAHNFTISKAKATATETTCKTVLWRPLKNDKIPYEDRFKY